MNTHETGNVLPQDITGKVPERPFEKIALSCSGGGYRAASFHLGAMSYLNRLPHHGRPLLEHVKMISTVSGGTFTGVIYALYKQEQKSFEEIYHFMLDRLRQLDLVKLGIEKLNPGAKWLSVHKRKNLINAFAELYDEHFTNGATLGAFDTMKSHLEAVVFNSTEFNKAINFRFRNRGTGVTGNRFNNIPAGVAGDIKLADAIAASSCFPGGFEPIMWPADFAHQQASLLNANKDGLQPAGLMDGGIYDNQGIDSILLYKKNAHPYFDLIIISDVTSPYMDGFKPFVEKAKTGWRTMTIRELIQRVKKYDLLINWFLISLVALFALLPLVSEYENNWFTGFSLGLSFGALLAGLLKWWIFGKVRKAIRKKIEKIERWIADQHLDFYYKRLSLLDVQNLSLHRAEPLLIDRISSLKSLLLNVFLKVVRRLNYKMVYENDKWKHRRISNLIRELTEADFNEEAKQPNKPTDSTGKPAMPAKTQAGTFDGPYKEVVGCAIKEIAEEVCTFGTTLWFTEKEQLDNMLNKLVATGQFTMCYNLIDYIEKLMYTPGNGYAELDAPVKAEVEALHTACMADWMRFKKDPLFLFNEMESCIER